MKLKNIPVCYHPATAVLIDDNRRYVENLSLRLSQEAIIPVPYDDPVAALEYINEAPHTKPFSERCLHTMEEDLHNRRQIAVDIQSIAQEIYNPRRYDEISLVIVDYAMPGLNGLEVCKAIKNPNINKILLTGEADESIAIDAFNKGLIQKFIRKEENDTFERELNDAINELQQKYFYQQSQFVIDALTHHPDHPAICMAMPEFLDMFNQLIEKYKFNEFYLVDTSGSFVLMNFKGNLSHLVIRDEEDMRAAAELAEMADSDVPAPVLEATANYSKVLYTGQPNDLRTDPAGWAPYLYPAKQLTDRGLYYYAFIEKDFQLEKQPELVSLRDYLEQQG